MIAKLAGSLGLAALALGLATPAAAKRDTAQYTSLTVFGDSLVDAGNIRALGLGANPAQGYFMGRFTNGYDYTDLLSISLFGTPTVASLGAFQGGTNFAYGGARASVTTPVVPDFAEQLALYTAYLAEGHTVDRNGLFVLNFGGNDIFNAPANDALADAWLRQSAKDYADGVQFLLNLGVRNILLTGFPVLTNPRSFTAEGYLTAELARVTFGADDTFYRFSYLDFFARVGTDPGSLGLPPLRTDTTCRAEGQAAIDGGCVGIFSFDGTHPTAAVHQALLRDMNRQFNLTGSVPEPATWAMMLFGFGLIGAGLRRRERVLVAT